MCSYKIHSQGIDICNKNCVCDLSIIHSRQFKFNILNILRDLSRSVLDKLILSKIDSLCGISIVAEQPMNNPIMLNITRPAVLRQYYGCDMGSPRNKIIKRATYGYKSHVGTDPSKFITKPFDINLKKWLKFL